MKVLLLLTLIYSTTAVVPNVKLNTGRNIPQIGLGTWMAKGDSVIQAIKDAIEIGYRHIDTAQYYNNEKEVGEALNAQIKAGAVKREDVFITTKVWPDNSNKEKALATVKQSLQLLNVTYVDLVLLHWPAGDWISIYKGLEDAFEQNLTLSIGISNFIDNKTIDELVNNTTIKPSVNQINIHPTLNQDETIDYCNKLGIAVIGYSPLGHGILIKDPILTQIGKKYNKTAPQVAIRWQIQRGLVVIPKSIHKNYIKENFEVFDFELSSNDMQTIHRMDSLFK